MKLLIGILACLLTQVSARGEDGVVREEVTFQNGAVTLSGDLLKPPGPGPFPVFVWCHGSGKAERKSVMFPKTFVNAGYALLTWDKPGAGKSGGRFYQQSLSARAKEVLAATEMVMKRTDVDARRVSFCGLSQAGYVLPRVVKAFPKAEKLVLIGPGSWSFSEERAYQLQKMPAKKLLRLAAGMNPGEVDECLGMFEKVFRASDADFVDAYTAFHQEAKGKPWYPKTLVLIPAPPENPDELDDFKLLFKEAFAFDGVEQYSGIHCPTLILFGENDECIDPKAGSRNIQAGFMKSGNIGLSIILYPGATHTLGGAKDKPEKDLLDWLSHHES